MKKQIILCLIALLLTFGCAGMKDFFALPQIDTSRSYHTSYERVWHAAMAAVAEKGLRVTSVEKDSGFIQTAYKTTDSTHMMQYAAPAGLKYTSCRYMVTVSVMQEDDGNVNVSVTLTAEGYTADNPEDFTAKKNMYWRNMMSFKYLERDILNAISAKLPGAAVVVAA